MDRRLSLCDRRLDSPWARLCFAAAALVFVVAGGIGLVISCEPFHGSWLRLQLWSDDLVNKSSERAEGTAGRTAGRTATSSGAEGLRVSRRMQEQRGQLFLESESLVYGLLKRYTSFAKYAFERSASTEPVPLPLVIPIGYRSSMSIPIVTIIGVQKGGTTNLRRNLLTHPLVSGMPNEVHFFDKSPEHYPRLGQWPGDGREETLGPGLVGRILSEYAKACLEEGKPSKKHKRLPVLSKGVIVESSPRYILSPLAPYRMRMVRPDAKLVVVLRDPTERYFSQLRMVMCKKVPDPGYASLEEMISTVFHPPGGAEGYLKRGEAAYQPYTALCRGENATSADLWGCFQSMEPHNPLHRGLYADQLERWFRVFDPSQILVVDSSEMFVDFTGTVARVAEHAGLPEHEFVYNPKHEFRGTCSKRHHRHGPDFFAEGGRYATMLEEEDLFREWYRPHNERLFRLLGREMMWR